MCCNASEIPSIKMPPVIIQGRAVSWVWGGQGKAAWPWHADSAVMCVGWSSIIREAWRSSGLAGSWPILWKPLGPALPR